MTSCRFCPQNWIPRPRSNSCYLITTSVRRPWVEAKLACEASNAYLLKLDDKEERLWIIQELAKIQATDPLRSSEWWLGLNDRKQRMKWVWTDGTPVDNTAIVWNDYEPNNWRGLEWCSELWGHGLNDKSCSAVQAYICERSRDVPYKCDNDHGWEEYNGTCYKYFSEELDWFNAERVCEEEDSQLVTVQDRRAQFYVNDVSLLNKKPLWLGLRYIKDEDSSDDENYQWKWADGKSVTLHYWKEGRYPAIDESVENDTCTYVDPFIKTVNIWMPGRCFESKSFICQKKTGSCEDGWELHQESCFQFNSIYRLSQPQAEKYCRDQGGHLIDIDSSYDQVFINSKLNELRSVGVMQFWLGLTVDSNGNYEWDSGEEVTYTNMGYQEREDNPKKKKCVVINTADVDGAWQTVSSCNKKESFVCEIKSGVKVKKAKKPPLYFRCAKDWISFNNYCYYFNNTRSTWIGAKTTCQQQKGSLAKVNDQDTQYFIDTMSQKNQWIGLNDRSQEGVMVWDSDGTKLLPGSYTNWMEEEPNNQEGHENCVLIFNRKPTLGKWVDFDCNRKFSFICQRLAENAPTLTPPTTLEPSVYDPRCGPEWEIGPTREFCYHFSDEQLSWFDARVTCHHHGGELASITEKSEQYFIAGRIRNFQSIGLWLGANDLTRESEWHWNDYSPMSYFNWGTGQPDNLDQKENCALLAKATSFWYDSDCRTRNGYICKKEATELTPTTLPLPTTISAEYYYHCASDWEIFNDKCYKVVDETYTWHDARKHCRKIGGDLISIDSGTEQTFAENILEAYEGLHLYWIGLNDINHKGTYTWSHGNKVEYTDWFLGEPNLLSSDSCVAMLFKDAKWRDYQCDIKGKSICEKELEISKRVDEIGCLPGYIMSGSKCYKYINILKNHEEARNYCRQVLNAQLPLVNNSFSQMFLARNSNRRKRVRYWISSESSKGPFKFWMRNRKAKLGDGTCLSFGPNLIGMWEAVPCNLKGYFICSLPLAKLPSSTTKPSSEITQTTPLTTTQLFTETLPPTTTSSPLIPCPNGWKHFNGYCYKEFSNYFFGLTWSKARENCRYAGSELVSIHSEEEMRFLQSNVMKLNAKYAYWTGAQITRNRIVAWTDKSNVDFVPRIYGEFPDSVISSCAVIQYATNTLVLRKCELFADWICKFKQDIQDRNFTPPKRAHCDLLGLDLWSHFNGSCFLSPLDFKKVTWHNSKTICQIFGGQLASIHSLEENSYILNTFHTYMWIGIHSHFSKPNNTWLDGSVIDFTNWDEGEPENIYEKPCTAIVPNTGKWRTFSCYKNFPSLCKRYEKDDTISVKPTKSMTGGCLKGFMAYDAKCFLIGGTGKGEQLSWQQAESKCRSYGDLYGLASINNVFEQAFITQMLFKFPSSLWIGMRVKEATLTWEDNSEISFIHLPNSQIEELFQLKYEHCVAMHTERTAAGMWFPAFCEERAGYICQGYRNNSIPLQTKVKDEFKSGYVKYRNSYYKYVEDLKTWQEAEVFCQSEGGHLVSVLDVYEEAFLYLLNNSDIEEFWMGATHKNGNFFWSDKSLMSYTDWLPIEEWEKNHNCGLFRKMEKWHLANCENHYASVCKISTENTTKEKESVVTETSGSCPEQWLEHDDNCFLMINDRTRSWPEAHYECAQIGANLASFHSESDVAFSQQKAKIFSVYLEGLWIGLSIQNGALTWSDDSPVNYENFMYGDTSNKGHASYATGYSLDTNRNMSRNCVLIDIRTGLWRRASCFYRLGFLCMSPKMRARTGNDALQTSTSEMRRLVKEKPNGLTTAQVVGIILVVPIVMILSAIIAYFVIKHKSVRLTTDGQGFVNSLYEAPNFMALKEDIEKNPS